MPRTTRFLRMGASFRALALALLPLGAFACGGGGGGGGSGGSGLEARDLASVTPSGTTAATVSGAGDFAADYLRSKNFTSLLVEIDYPAGTMLNPLANGPSAAAVQLLHDRLAERCDKPDGIAILVDDAIPKSEFPSVLSVADLADLESTHRDNYSDLSTKTAVMYILYVSGKSDLDGAGTFVLGLSYAGSSIGFFIDNADPSSGVTRAEVEGAGLIHEVGHLMGLVDGGVPMVVPHEAATSAFHDSSADCVMYWLIDLQAGGPNIGDDDFATYDVHCRDDMAAFGGLCAGPPARVRAASRIPRPSGIWAPEPFMCGSAAGARGWPSYGR